LGLKIVNTNLKIAKAALILIVASTCGHILSLGKEILVANYFGITKVMDAFYAAITVPNLINGVLLSTFGAVFIPVFIRYKLKDKEEANRVASVLINYLSLFLILWAVLIFIFAPWITTYGFHGFEPETNLLAVKLLRIACLVLVFSGLIGAMTGILNAFEHFAWPAFSQMFVTLSTIFFILFFVKKWGIFVLAYGLIAGLIIQFFFLIPIIKHKGYHHYFDFQWRHPAVKEMLFMALPFFIAIVMSELNIVVDRVMASYLTPGSIAALGYAGRLVQVPLVIFSSSIATAVFPFFATQVAENKMEEMKDSLAKSIRMAGFIFIPLTVMLIILARPLIQLLFQRGAFTQEATGLTSIILVCYSFQLFFYTGGILLGRVFFALRQMMTVLKMAIFGLILNVILNFVFIRLITPPAAGLALSTSGVCFFGMLIQFVFLKRRLKSLREKYILKGLVRIIIVSIVMGWVTFTLFHRLTDMSNFQGVSGQITLIGLIIILGLAIFGGLSFLLRIEEIGKILEKIKIKT